MNNFLKQAVGMFLAGGGTGLFACVLLGRFGAPISSEMNLAELAAIACLLMGIGAIALPPESKQ